MSRGFRTFGECVNILPEEITTFAWRIQFHRGDGKGPQEGFVGYFVGATLKEVTEIFEAKFPYATILSDGMMWRDFGAVIGGGFKRVGFVYIVDPKPTKPLPKQEKIGNEPESGTGP